MKKILAVVALVVLTLGLSTGPTEATTRYPSATQNWHPRPGCFKYHKVGAVSPRWHLGDVWREYTKVRHLPRLVGFHGHCPGVPKADIYINQSRHYKFCSKWGDNNRLLLKASPSCFRHAREFACSGVGRTVGADYYRHPRPGTRPGCLWINGTGPAHLSRVEKRVLRRAWS